MKKQNIDPQLSITIDKVNGIREPVTLDIPRLGGVVELVGHNGVGKTTTTNLILAAHGEDIQQLSGTDGGEGNAWVTDGDRSIHLKLSSSRLKKDGKTLLGLASDQGKALAVLIEPNLKDPEAAERERLKAIASIYPKIEFGPDQLKILTMGLELSAVMKFGRSEVSVLDAAKLGAPLPDIANAIRNSLNATKRTWEKQATEADGVMKDTTKDLGQYSKESDPQITVAEAEEYHSQCAKQAFQAGHEWSRRQAAMEARKALVARIEAREEPKLDEARADAESLAAEVRELEALLATKRERASAAKQALIRLEADHRQWVADQEALKETTLPGCEESVVKEAQEALKDAEETLASARAWQRKMELKDKLKIATLDKQSAAEKAEAYEQAAKSVWSNLGKVMAQAGIKTFTFDDGVLAVEHNGQLIPYKDLSFGLRVAYGFKAEIEALTQIDDNDGPKLCALDPNFWLALDPDRQLEVDELAIQAGLTVLTERPARGGLRAETFSGE